MGFIDSSSSHSSSLHIKKNYFKKEIDVFVVFIYIIVAVIMCIVLPNEYINTVLYYLSVILGASMFAGLAQKSKSPFFFNIYMSLSFFLLFFTYGFRSFSGVDDNSYINIFYKISDMGWFDYFLHSTMEPGYLILNTIIILFTDNYFYMQLLTSLLPLLIFYYGFKKYRYMISLPTAVFLLCSMLYFQMLSVALIRMFIGISIVFVAFYYIPKRKPIKYVLMIILASLFHYSAFFMVFFVYFAINKKNLSQKASRLTTVLFIATPLIFIVIANYIVPLLGDRYSIYGNIESANIGLFDFTSLPMLLFLMLFYKKFNNENQLYFKLFLIIYSLSIIISLFGDMVGLGRLIFYPYLGFILGAAMVSQLLRRDSKKIILYFILISYAFIYIYATQFSLESHVPHLFPYRNIYFNI